MFVIHYGHTLGDLERVLAKGLFLFYHILVDLGPVVYVCNILVLSPSEPGASPGRSTSEKLVMRRLFGFSAKDNKNKVIKLVESNGAALVSRGRAKKRQARAIESGARLCRCWKKRASTAAIRRRSWRPSGASGPCSPNSPVFRPTSLAMSQHPKT